MLLSVFLDYECSNSTCNLPKSLFYEKYDSDWDSMRDYFVALRDEAVERQHVERFFHEVQGDQPPQAQDFFNYWSDYDPTAQEDYYFQVDDWDEN